MENRNRGKWVCVRGLVPADDPKIKRSRCNRGMDPMATSRIILGVTKKRHAPSCLCLPPSTVSLPPPPRGTGRRTRGLALPSSFPFSAFLLHLRLQFLRRDCWRKVCNKGVVEKNNNEVALWSKEVRTKEGKKGDHIGWTNSRAGREKTFEQRH